MSVAPLYQEIIGCGLDPLAVQVRSRRSPARTDPPTAAPVMSTVKGRTVGWKEEGEGVGGIKVKGKEGRKG